MTAIKFDRDRVYASVMELLNETARLLALYIKGVLQPLSRDWWQRYVSNSLSPADSETYKNAEIIDLDLGRLLRVLNYNWNVFKEKKNLTPEDRNYAKEMQTVRHRWAHKPAKGLPHDIIYRDLDTLERFADMIESPRDFIEKVKAAKKCILLVAKEEDDERKDKDQENKGQEGKGEEDNGELTLEELVKKRTNLSSKDKSRYTNFYKGGRVKFQLHPNPHGVDLAIPEPDENLPSCKILKQVDIKSLHGYKGDKGASPNTDWLEGNGKRFTKRPAVAFHLPEEMKDNSEHAGWKELDMLVKYAVKR